MQESLRESCNQKKILAPKEAIPEEAALFSDISRLERWLGATPNGNMPVSELEGTARSSSDNGSGFIRHNGKEDRI